MRLFASRAVEAPARREVRLAPEDRRQAELARRVVKLHRAVHHAVIRERHRRRSSFGRPPAKAVDPARSVEKRIFRVHVQMDELTHVNAFYGAPRTNSSRVQWTLSYSPSTPLWKSSVEGELARLRASASRWASLPVARKIELLAACRDATGCVARDWTAGGRRAQGHRRTQAEGEEAMTGPWALAAALNRYIVTLRRIERSGAAGLSRRAIRRRPGGQIVVGVFPEDLYDRLLLPGVRAEVWLRPGASPSTLRPEPGAHASRSFWGPATSRRSARSMRYMRSLRRVPRASSSCIRCSTIWRRSSKRHSRRSRPRGS